MSATYIFLFQITDPLLILKIHHQRNKWHRQISVLIINKIELSLISIFIQKPSHNLHPVHHFWRWPSTAPPLSAPVYIWNTKAPPPVPLLLVHHPHRRNCSSTFDSALLLRLYSVSCLKFCFFDLPSGYTTCWSHLTHDRKKSALDGVDKQLPLPSFFQLRPDAMESDGSQAPTASNNGKTMMDLGYNATASSSVVKPSMPRCTNPAVLEDARRTARLNSETSAPAATPISSNPRVLAKAQLDT